MDPKAFTDKNKIPYKDSCGCEYSVFKKPRPNTNSFVVTNVQFKEPRQSKVYSHHVFWRSKKKECPEHKRAKDLELAIAEAEGKLSGVGQKIYGILDSLLDKLLDRGVDISYFPEAGRMTLIQAAEEIEREVIHRVECGPNNNQEL